MEPNKASAKKRVIILSAREIKLATVPARGDIVFRFELPDSEKGEIPEFDLAIRVSPDEARRLALALADLADEIEGMRC